MSGQRVRELAGWGFDENPYRPVCDGVVVRGGFEPVDCLVEVESAELAGLLEEAALRVDLLEEMEGLVWELGVVDLRGVIAFQRRVVVDAACGVGCGVDDWVGLMEVCFGAAVEPMYRVSRTGDEVVIVGESPNLQVRPSARGLLEVHGGSPFFEVAEYRGRWFLRDGYHRAYGLLRAGVVRVPAVVVRARTMEELGAVGEWFFAKEVLFAERPPLVRDFLEDGLTVEYERPRRIKKIRVRVEESFEVVEGASG